MKLDAPLTIPQIAKMLKWTPKRTLRRLHRLEERNPGRVLLNVGTTAMPKYTVTLGALQRVAEQWFADDEVLSVSERLDAHEEKLALHDGILNVHRQRFVQLASK